MEAQSEHVHVACTFCARLVPDSYAHSVLINKTSSSELSRKLIKGALSVGFNLLHRKWKGGMWLQRLINEEDQLEEEMSPLPERHFFFGRVES